MDLIFNEKRALKGERVSKGLYRAHEPIDFKRGIQVVQVNRNKV